MTDRAQIWQSVQQIWEDAKKEGERKPGRPGSVAARIAALVFPGHANGMRRVRRGGLDRPMMEEAWFASLSNEVYGCTKRPRKVKKEPVSIHVDDLVAISERMSRLRRTG